MADDGQQPVVIKKVVKKGGHHGGSWKVALADFMTAMMAFFLLMWLVGMTDAEQRGAISEYFKNPSRIEGQSDIPTNNPVQGEGGGSNSAIDLGGSPSKSSKAPSRDGNSGSGSGPTEAEARALERLLEDLQKKIQANDNLEPYKDQLLLDIVDQGMRIQIVDKAGRPMFSLGSVRIKDYAEEILAEIAPELTDVSNRISITGHTDARAFDGTGNYTNWELSTERANTARRALIEAGLDPNRIARVVGLADRVPFRPDNPGAPINRRIAIIVMTDKAEQEMMETRARQAANNAQAVAEPASQDVDTSQ